MADDDDAIYIDVIPKVDDSALDQLKDKLKDAASEVGPEFMDALGSSGALEQLGTRLGEALSGPLKDLSEGVGLDLKNPLEKLVKQDLGGALDDVVGQLGTKLGSVLSDPLKGVADTLGVDLGDAVSKALNKDWGGLGADLGRGLGGKIAEGLGIDGGELDDALSTVNGLVTTLHGLHSRDLHGALSGVNSLLGDGTEQPTPISNFLQGSGLNHFVEKIPIVGQSVGDIEQAVQNTYSAVPTSNPDPRVNPHGWWGTMFGAASNLMPWVHDRPQPGAPDHGAEALANMQLGQAVPRGLYGSPNAGQGPTTAGEVEVRAGSANVEAGTVVLSGGLSLPRGVGTGASSSASPRGRGSAATVDANSRGGSVVGDLEKNLGLPAHDAGGPLPGPTPGHDNQLFSGEGGEFVVNPSATANNMNTLNAINSGTNFDESNRYGEKQQEQMGTGQGFGLTGSGAIGFAESLPGILGSGAASSAGSLAPGAGAAAALAASAWQNIGQPEVNEAIKSGTQIAAAAALAPIETGWLGGGQMGAPTVGSPAKSGWPGKILGGLLGSQFSMPNLAGAGTQPPKDPKQGDDPNKAHEDGDPGKAGKSGKAKQGPTGHADDPIHVQPAPGSQSQQQPKYGSGQGPMTAVASAAGGAFG